MYKFIFNKFLIHTDPEKIHKFVHFLLRIYGCVLKIFPFLKLNKTNHNFGIAAGFDKDASAVIGLYGLGFGFIEIGTVTYKAQIGNEKPRMWRHVDEFALRNNMGFPGPGVDKVADNLKKLRNCKIGKKIIVGANIGKNEDVAPKDAINDYLNVAKKISKYTDYVVVNVSCPNTPNLQVFQNEKFLKPLLVKLKSYMSKYEKKPIYVKISPDLPTKSIKGIANVVNDAGIAGIIAVNTTTDHKYSKGGISGKTLKPKALKIIKELKKYLDSDKEIIGCGGIFDKKDREDFIKAGANRTQGYTGFIYKGPFFVRGV